MHLDVNWAQQGASEASPLLVRIYKYIYHVTCFTIHPRRALEWVCLSLAASHKLRKCFPFLTHYVPNFIAVIVFIQEIPSEMEDDHVNVSFDQSDDVSLYLFTPERMVRDSISVHLALMSAWCVCVCVCVCVHVCVV